MMHEVLSNMTLHLQAAEGNVKTGMSVVLDSSSQVDLIVRKAGAFWDGAGRATVPRSVSKAFPAPLA